MKKENSHNLLLPCVFRLREVDEKDSQNLLYRVSAACGSSIKKEISNYGSGLRRESSSLAFCSALRAASLSPFF